MAWGAQQPRARNAGSHRRSRLLTCDRPPQGASLPLPAGRLASAAAAAPAPPRPGPSPSPPLRPGSRPRPRRPRCPSRPGCRQRPRLPHRPPQGGLCLLPGRPALCPVKACGRPARLAVERPGQSRWCPLRRPRTPPAATAAIFPPARAEAPALGKAGGAGGEVSPAPPPARVRGSRRALPLAPRRASFACCGTITPGASRQPPRPGGAERGLSFPRLPPRDPPRPPSGASAGNGETVPRLAAAATLITAITLSTARLRLTQILAPPRPYRAACLACST